MKLVIFEVLLYYEKKNKGKKENIIISYLVFYFIYKKLRGLESMK